ncbi:folate-binding protein YgfZ [Holosporaceae bacterium 'Namur']|nr:folate-binding protein YgfZ [Holosporaceae bacterium 'Namur']
MEYFLLENREVIAISGADRGKFLQGIISNDIGKINLDSYIYALMLTPQGKLLYDFFIIERDNSYLLDCPKPFVEEIVKKFNVYKLRSDINISRLIDHKIYASFSKLNNLFLPDPRNTELGFRAIINPSISFIGAPLDIRKYDLKRMELLIPDMVSDLESGTYFPLELHLDELNAIDYKKGCYVGQEVTARTHYRGVVRKNLYRIEVIEGEQLEPKINIYLGEKKVGQTLGFVGSQGLGLLRTEEIETAKDLLFTAHQSYIRVIF